MLWPGRVVGRELGNCRKLDDGRSSKPPSLDGLTALVSADLEMVNRCIVERMHSPVELIPLLAGHIIAPAAKDCGRC